MAAEILNMGKRIKESTKLVQSDEQKFPRIRQSQK